MQRIGIGNGNGNGVEEKNEWKLDFGPFAMNKREWKRENVLVVGLFGSQFCSLGSLIEPCMDPLRSLYFSRF